MLTNSLLIIDGSAMLSKHYYSTIPKELFKETNPDIIKELKKENINKIIEEITPADSVVCKKDNAKIIVELLNTNDEDRAEQITKYLYNEKKR